MRNEMSLDLLEDGDFSRSITKMSWRYWRRLKMEMEMIEMRKWRNED
jgi:hypothetical protein